jgi:hypothetical protein
MRGTRLAAGVLFLGLLSLAGCTVPEYVNPMAVTVSPATGHPPFTVTITVAGRHGGEYLFQLPDGDVRTDSPTITATVDCLDWHGSVVWTRGDLCDMCEIVVEVVNAPPVIGRPTLAPFVEWYLCPRQRTLLDFNFHSGGAYGTWTGIYDPNGDGWRLVLVTVQAPLKADQDSIFCAPYVPGVFHATWRANVIENAVVLYPLYTGKDVGGLPCSPQGLTEEGYPTSPYQNPNLYYGQAFPEQVATLTVVAEDSWGARTLRKFGIRVGALAYPDSHLWPQPDG